MNLKELEQKVLKLEEEMREVSKLRQLMNKEEKMFEWEDGALVEAMRTGGLILIDEINMAEDSVLERLNSVLEIERKLLITELNQEITA